MTIALVFFIAALAYAIYEALSMKRGVLGWIVNIIAVFVGVFVAAEIFSLVFELILPFLHLDGTPFVAAGGVLPYAALTVMMIVNLLGAWTAIKIVNWWR